MSIKRSPNPELAHLINADAPEAFAQELDRQGRPTFTGEH
jgi:hypothetical protein